MRKSHLLDVYSVWLHVADTPKDWKAIAKREGLSLGKPDGSLGFTLHTVVSNDFGSIHHISIYIAGKAHSESDIAMVETCAHEAAHAGCTVLEVVDSPREGEPLAYLVGWITQWLYKAVRST